MNNVKFTENLQIYDKDFLFTMFHFSYIWHFSLQVTSVGNKKNINIFLIFKFTTIFRFPNPCIMPPFSHLEYYKAFSHQFSASLLHVTFLRIPEYYFICFFGGGICDIFKHQSRYFVESTYTENCSSYDWTKEVNRKDLGTICT